MATSESTDTTWVLDCYPEDVDASSGYETLEVTFENAPASGMDNVSVR